MTQKLEQTLKALKDIAYKKKFCRLEFFKPMKATNTAEFTFKPDGSKTTVTWTMTGKNNFIGKAFGLIVNCDKMCGGQFEKGLADMKTVAEAAADKQSAVAV